MSATRSSLLLLACVLAPAAAQARPMKFAEQIVEAEVQKPEIQVYVTRQNLNKAYDLELKESFIPRIIEALEKPPF